MVFRKMSNELLSELSCDEHSAVSVSQIRKLNIQLLSPIFLCFSVILFILRKCAVNEGIFNINVHVNLP
jgi:hypothetical protein